MSTQTWLAVSTWCPWLEGNPISYFQCLDCRTDFDDCACRFVAQDHGSFQHELPDRAVFPVMYIAATDTSPVDSDEDMVGRLEFWLGLLLEGYVEGLVEHEGEVLDIFVRWNCCVIVVSDLLHR